MGVKDKTLGTIDYALKFIYVGDFSIQYVFTLSPFGTDFIIKNFVVDDFTIRALLFFIQGQEGYISILRSMLRASCCAIICFDVTNIQSFQNVKTRWVNEVIAHCSFETKMRSVIVGLKADRTEDRQVSYEDAKNFADTHKFAYYEINSATDHSVDVMFNNLVKSIIFGEYSGMCDPEILPKEIQQHKKKIK